MNRGIDSKSRHKDEKLNWSWILYTLKKEWKL